MPAVSRAPLDSSAVPRCRHPQERRRTQARSPILSPVSDDEEALRLRRELADAKVEQLQARLAELQGTTADAVASSPVASTPSPSPATSTASPEAQEALRQLLGRVGFAGYLPGSASPPPGPDLPLSMPPRRVPASYRLFLLPWSWWTVFTLVMVATAPIAIWLFWPVAGVAVAIVAFLAVMGLAIRRYARLIGLLRWGQQATSVEAVPVDIGTYYSGTTYQNMRLPIARGWHVARQFYSGPGTKTRVRYQLGGSAGEVTLRGREYIDGVILVNSRKPEVAACVTSIPFDLSERTPSGDWSGRVRASTAFGAVAMFVVVVGWTAGMLLIWGQQAASMDQLPHLF